MVGAAAQAAFLGSDAARRAEARLAGIARVARQHASIRSVWLLNSLRGAVALGAAVAVADLTSVQHGFWVVLGTLSVLRSNAVATGATALRAIAGTAVGFVIGGLLLVAIGASSDGLWIVLPIAVFLAAYTPGTAPFAVGQAAFTVTVAILFNLLVPAGWRVGVVRIEDVALGCGVSVIVGLLFWPRGLASVVGEDLADAFRSGAYYLRQAVQWVANAQDEEADGAASAAAAAARLDESLRGFLTEQGTKHLELQELWRLVGGAMRLRLTAYSIAGLSRDRTLVGSAQAALILRTSTLAGWFEGLAGALDTRGRTRGCSHRAAHVRSRRKGLRVVGLALRGVALRASRPPRRTSRRARRARAARGRSRASPLVAVKARSFADRSDNETEKRSEMTKLSIEELFSVAGKTVLVTGGSRGIGEMIAAGFLANGAKVYISSRKAEVCDATAARLAEEHSGTCVSIPADLATVDGRGRPRRCDRRARAAARRARQQRRGHLGRAAGAVPRERLGQGHGHERQGRLLPHPAPAAPAGGRREPRFARAGDQHRLDRRDQDADLRQLVLRRPRRRPSTP